MSTNSMTFTKEDLVRLATSGDSVAIRESAAEALYKQGRADGTAELFASVFGKKKNDAEMTK